MLDERTLRRPEFAEGTPIRLGDGQEWHLPRPIVQHLPVETEDGALVFGARRLACGPRFDALFDRMVSAEGEEGIANAALNLGAYLLRLNYSLTIADLQVLLPCDGTEDNQAMWQSIIDSATGIGPKASAGGSAVPS